MVSLIFLAGLAGIFMWKTVLLNQAAFPGDLLYGAYYPWMTMSLPVKNPLISDVFSQVFTWKALIVNAYREWQLPLWNPYTLSGYPLLANFHSGALYPGNLWLLGNFISGWNRLLWWQLFASAGFMFCFLRSLKLPYLASLAGALTYAFGGFALVMWQLVHAGQAMIWIPALLLAIERKKPSFIPAGVFLLVTAGHAQTLVYGLLMVSGFALVKSTSRAELVKYLAGLGLGLGLAGLQLLPFWEQAQLSVRESEHYIERENFGLLPPSSLATLVAPDFFGHPATRNYWGTFNYQERTIYLGVLGLFGLVWAGFSYRRLARADKYWLLVALISLALALDTPIGRAVYVWKIPGLSTASASRVAVALLTASAILAAGFTDRLRRGLSTKFACSLLVAVFAITAFGFTHRQWTTHTGVIARNLVWPSAIVGSLATVFALSRKRAWLLPAVILILIMDLFRFGWKYNPFVPQSQVFGSTPVTDWLAASPGLFRIDREDGPVLPPNTWEFYKIMAAPGYDPMSPSGYTRAYHSTVNNRPQALGSRYTVADRFDPDKLALFGIKYILTTAPQNKDQKMTGYGLTKVFTANNVAVWENPKFSGLVQLSRPGTAAISSFRPGAIDIHTESASVNELTIRSAFFPGWLAKVGPAPVPVLQTSEHMIKIIVPANRSLVQLRYFPASLVWGFGLTSLSLAIYLVWLGLPRPDGKISPTGPVV